MTIDLLLGDSRQLATTLPDASVNTIVTSPPYWGLRDYGVSGQLGLERTPEEYVCHLVELFRELRRVLRDDGTLWLNLGDSYSGSGKGDGGDSRKQTTNRGSQFKSDLQGIVPSGTKPKDLVGIPWRVAFALQADGWYLRSDIIWHKPNPMPESVTDRPTKSHEYIFLLSKQSSYYYDADAVREPHARLWDASNGGNLGNGIHKRNGAMRDANRDYPEPNALGRNRRSVWTVTTKPFREAHFATFPPDLIRPCILAGCPARTCPKCGAPWERVTERTAPSYYSERKGHDFTGRKVEKMENYKSISKGKPENSGVGYSNTVTLGFRPTCDCGLTESVPGVVLDPFNGAGTTGVVAVQEGRNYIGLELNPDYLAMSRRRIEQVQPALLPA